MVRGIQFHFNLKPFRFYSENRISLLVILQAKKGELFGNIRSEELQTQECLKA